MTANTQTFSAIAIIIGSALVAWVIFDAKAQTVSGDQLTIQREVAAERHIYGSEHAETVIVEFSDYECPFCSRLHPTLKEIVDESDGSVAWEYRHLPLPNHPLAGPAAAMSECVHDALGNGAFWQFGDSLFENQRVLSHEFILNEAKSLGLSSEAIEACSTNQALADRISNDTAAASALGGSGTPFSVILYPDNTYKPVVGAVPKDQWVALLNLHNE